MTNLTEAAKAYVPTATKNIADLEVVRTDAEIKDDSFDMEEDGKTKTINMKVIEVNGEKYRVPVSVLKNLKAILEAKPGLKTFQVKKTGQGMNTDYTVIPLD